MNEESNKNNQNLTDKEIYNIVSDLAVGYNSRKTDNNLQIKITFVVMIISGIIGAWVYKSFDWFMFGCFGGLFFGIVISGIYIMIFRAIKHIQGDHK